MKKRIIDHVWVVFPDGTRKWIGKKVIYLQDTNKGILTDGREVVRECKWIYRAF